MARTPIPYQIERVADLTFESVYEDLVAFVWRTARRLGVDGAALDDVCQDVFLAVHNGLSDFDGLSSVRTWVFGILQNRVLMYRRSVARKNLAVRTGSELVDADRVGTTDKTPYELVSSAQALQIAHGILDTLSDEKREVFVLVELEQWSIVDAAAALDVNVNTASARLRAARKEFAQAAHRVRIRDSVRNRDSWRPE